MKEINILGIKYGDTDIAGAVEYAVRMMEAQDSGYVLVPSSDTVLAARKNRRLMEAFREASLVLAGDRGIFAAAEILGEPLHYKMSGLDFASALLARLSSEGRSFFLLGSKPQEVNEQAQRLALRYPGLKIAGSADGQFVDDEELIEQINLACPDLLLVCLSSPKQELWVNKTYSQLNAAMVLCIGDVTERKNKRHEQGFIKSFTQDPKTALKVPRMASAALIKRIFG